MLAEHIGRNPLGQGLDQIQRLAFDVRQRQGADLAVVHRVRQGIALPGPGQVGLEFDVDDELLAVTSLVLEDTVEAAPANASQPDEISHRYPAGRL